MPGPMKLRRCGRNRIAAGTIRLEYLNGLRGLAALVVVFHHFAYVFLVFATRGAGANHFAIEKTIYTTPLQLLVAGNFAVCIFFILSGYVLSYAFFQTGKTSVVQKAAVKRYFRLMPPILGSVLLAWAIIRLGLNFSDGAAAISGSSWLANFWPRTVSLGEAVYYGAYGILVGNSSPGLLNNALWTMKVELIGSMLVFGFLGLFGKLRLRWLMYALLAMATWNSYYLAFVLGIALCDVTNRSWSPKQLAWPITAGLALVGLWLGAAPIPGATSTIYSSFGWPGADPNVVFILTHIIGATMLLGAVVYSPVLKLVFASRPLRYLGKISFSMYLLHLLVLGTISSYMFTVLSVSHGYLLSLLVTGAAYLVIVTIAADIFTRHVDEPSVKLANWLQKRIMSPRRPSTDTRPARQPAMMGASRADASNI